MSPSIAKKRHHIMWKLRTGRPQPTLYIIALAKNNDLYSSIINALDYVYDGIKNGNYGTLIAKI